MQIDSLHEKPNPFFWKKKKKNKQKKKKKKKKNKKENVLKNSKMSFADFFPSMLSVKLVDRVIVHMIKYVPVL